MVSEPARPFTVLFVCTGNICRSAIAEHVLREMLPTGEVSVMSSGTRSMVGRPMTQEAVRVALHGGARSTSHSARDLSEAQITASDLILTATRAHRSLVVSMVPRASRITFTLNEFARLLDFGVTSELPPLPQIVGADAFREYVGAISRLRGLMPPPMPAEDDDIEDPYGKSDDVYDRVGARIFQGLTSIAPELTKIRSR